MSAGDPRPRPADSPRSCTQNAAIRRHTGGGGGVGGGPTHPASRVASRCACPPPVSLEFCKADFTSKAGVPGIMIFSSRLPNRFFGGVWPCHLSRGGALTRRLSNANLSNSVFIRHASIQRLLSVIWLID